MALRKARQWMYVSVGLVIILFALNYSYSKSNEGHDRNDTIRVLFVTDSVADERRSLVAVDSLSQQINEQLNLPRHALSIRSVAFVSHQVTAIELNGMACEVNRLREKQLTEKGNMLIVDLYLDERFASRMESVLTSKTSFCSPILGTSVEKRAPSCTDRTKNQDETDVDCGGRTCTRKCEPNQRCSTNMDCFNGNCHTFLKTCQAPSCTDGNQNEDEIDVDCGGANCSTLCTSVYPCLSNEDCLTRHCDIASRRCLDL